MTYDVVVIGAGVSGLSTAHELMCHGHDVAVLERQVVVGGNTISERFDGFLMEYGPSAMHAIMPEALEFARELDLEASCLELGENVRKRYLLDAGKLSGISVHPLGFFASDYLSLPARLSLLSEIMRPRRKPSADETLYDFTRRRFGDEFARKVMEPMAAGLFMGDSRALSVGAVFPRLVEFEQKYGSVTRAVINARRGSQPGRRLFSWPDGMGTLPQRLAQLLGARIHTGTTVKKIAFLASGFEIETVSSGTLRTRAVVLAVQPHVAAALLGASWRRMALSFVGIAAAVVLLFAIRAIGWEFSWQKFAVYFGLLLLIALVFALEVVIQRVWPGGAQRHRVLGRFTLWNYGALFVTGSFIYVMLYVLYPGRIGHSSHF